MNNEAIIPVAERRIGDELVQTVNGRELHAFLGCGELFPAWIKQRIEQYGFIENTDFVCFMENPIKPHGGRPRVEYAITIDMAKELAMVERNDKGKRARQYFIECERIAKQAAQTPEIHRHLNDPGFLRGLLGDYAEKVLTLQATIQEQAPKVQFHDAVTEATNCQSIQEVAKILKWGPNRLFEFLRAEGILMKTNLPYQQFVDAGHFRVVERAWTDGDGERHTYSRTLVTGKGFVLIQRRLSPGIQSAPQPFGGSELTVN